MYQKNYQILIFFLLNTEQHVELKIRAYKFVF
jgi:hypothetical protein